MKKICYAVWVGVISFSLACSVGNSRPTSAGTEVDAANKEDNASSDGNATGAYRAQILYFVEDPVKTAKPEDAYRYFKDGLLVVKKGKIVAVGEFNALKGKVENLIGSRDISERYRNDLILPGFIDTHIHYPQTEMIVSYGQQLLEWLTTYTFPTERLYQDEAHAREVAKVFLRELLRNGTTTALVFGTVHKQSVDALFDEASDINMRLIAGKVMMDRNAPDYLIDTPETSFQDTKALIERWHGRNRLLYAITPRFAPTSSPEQLNKAAELKKLYPGVYMHTHLSENLSEIEWVKSLFPQSENYLDVYDSYRLTGPHSVFAHGIHLSEKEFQVLHDTDSAIAFCPTSNLFLGSGLFKMREAKKAGREVKVGMGTDVGAGTSFNMLETLNEAYKVVLLQQNGQQSKVPFSAFEGFYQATLGSARALELEDKIGTFAPGTEADFVVLSWSDTALQNLRMGRTDQKLSKGEMNEAQALADKLFVLMTIGDDRNIKATYVDGRLAHQRKNGEYTNRKDWSPIGD